MPQRLPPELHWGLSWIGPMQMVGPFFVVYSLRQIESSFPPYLSNRNAVLVHVIGLVTLGMYLLGHSLSCVIVHSVRSLLPPCLALGFGAQHEAAR